MKPPTENSRHNLPEGHKEVSVLRITDPTAVGDSIEVLNMDVINLDPEGFEYKQVSVPLAECCLIYQWTNTPLRTHSRVHEDFESCWILGPQAHGSLDGTELHSYALIAAGPGADGELIAESDYENVGWLVPPRVLQEHLNLRGKRGDFAIPKNHEVWHPTAEAARDLFELGVRIAEEAEKAPQIFNDNHWARIGAQVEFMDALFATIESCNSDDYVDTDEKGRSNSEIVRACEDYTLNLDGRRPYLSELCAAANVGERTLQYAFRDIMGMSPLSFLNRLRLHRARDDLRGATSDSTTVTDVAMNWGFWQLGDFSRAYKSCFGESPSETLKRQTPA
jgi:AraC family ethanolamine operon transcriptional activator